MKKKDSKYTFYISYFSEVSVQITMEYQSGLIKATCRHPLNEEKGKRVPLGASWFHFTGPHKQSTELVATGHTVRKVLDRLAEKLWKGVVWNFDNMSDREMKEWFRQHLYTAFVFGQFTPYWTHQRIEVVDRKI